MTIRAANEADIPAIIEIERTPGFEQFFGWFSEDEHRAHLTDPDCRVLVWTRMASSRALPCCAGLSAAKAAFA